MCVCGGGEEPSEGAGAGPGFLLPPELGAGRSPLGLQAAGRAGGDREAAPQPRGEARGGGAAGRGGWWEAGPGPSACWRGGTGGRTTGWGKAAALIWVTGVRGSS